MKWLFFPIFILVWSLGRNKKNLIKDTQNWCEWKQIKFSFYNAFKFFCHDKAYRNLFYYRIGSARILLCLIFPGYDHLQITTPSNKIGGGMIIQHGFSTIVSAAQIGENFKVYQQVTIGYNHKLQAPIIGNNVEVCCGAKIIGGVKIGNNVLIGANAVVIKDIPDNTIVAGIPAKVISRLVQN